MKLFNELGCSLFHSYICKNTSETLPYHDIPKNLFSAMTISMTANIQEKKPKLNEKKETMLSCKK